MDGLGIDAQPATRFFAAIPDAVQQRLGDDSFAVVAHYHAIEPGKGSLEFREQCLGGGRVDLSPGFAVEAHDLLLPSHDAHLGGSASSCGGHQTATSDAFRSEQIPKGLSGFVSPDHSGQFSVTGKGCDIPCNIGRSAGHEILPIKIHDGNRGLGRDTTHPTPDKLVQHHIADDPQPCSGRRRQEFPEPRLRQIAHDCGS